MTQKDGGARGFGGPGEKKSITDTLKEWIDNIARSLRIKK